MPMWIAKRRKKLKTPGARLMSRAPIAHTEVAQWLKILDSLNECERVNLRMARTCLEQKLI